MYISVVSTGVSKIRHECFELRGYSNRYEGVTTPTVHFRTIMISVIPNDYYRLKYIIGGLKR